MEIFLACPRNEPYLTDLKTLAKKLLTVCPENWT